MSLNRLRSGATIASTACPRMAWAVGASIGGTAIPFPASDAFSGAGTDSGSVGDANDTRRWTHNEDGGGSISIGSGILSHVRTGAGVINHYSVLNYSSLSGGFVCSVDATINTTQDAGNDIVAARLWLNTSPQYLISVEYNGTGAANPGWHYEVTVNGSVVASGTPSALSSMKWTRTGTTLAALINGSSVWSGTNSTTFANIYLASVSVNRGEFDIDYDNFVLTNSAGTPIYL